MTQGVSTAGAAKPESAGAPKGAGAGYLTLRIGIVITAASILLQAFSAGEVLTNGSLLSLHGAGAAGVHGGALIAAIGATLLWRPARLAGWPALVTWVLFLATFAQSAMGSVTTLNVHVPLAIALTLVTTWVLVWSFIPPRAPAAK
ncbi:hypothetical protein [Amycolatopsis nigrescens]|uniref:hypothetical protein n=1 Tax=Amycolatopsis nigrescens TaxID=381445 RepID=UPI000365F3BF|nr:hypothetical protein [Amycolatopsis nigrescens]